MRHWDGNARNNAVGNLTYGTRSENLLDGVRNGHYRNGNTGKTHCKHGHEFTPENTYVQSRGQRGCVKCRRRRSTEASRRRRLRLKGSA